MAGKVPPQFLKNTKKSVATSKKAPPKKVPPKKRGGKVVDTDQDNM